MALTITKPHPDVDSVFGNKRIKVRDIEFDSSYPTAGEGLVPSDVGLTRIDQVLPQGPAGNSDGTASTSAVVVRYDHTNEKLQAFQGDADATTGSAVLAEVGSTDSLADFHVRVTFIGH